MGGFIKRWTERDVLEAVQKLKPLAAQAGCSLTQFSLAWVLREPNVASAMRRRQPPEQLDENAGASGLAIDPTLFRQGRSDRRRCNSGAVRRE